MSKALRRIVCRILIGVVLFSQLAIAGYACPGLASTDSAVREVFSSRALASDTADAWSPSSDNATAPAMTCDGDMGVANLCLEHCKYGQQSLEQSEVPAVPPAAPNGQYVVVSDVGQLQSSVGFLTGRPAPPVSAPHAVLHCCFRI